MKLRCSTNSVRIRLRKSEVAELMEKGAISEKVGFGPEKSFSLSLSLDELLTKVQASISNNNLIVTLPYSLGGTWAKTDQVGITGEQDIGNGDFLEVLLKKDYPCVTRPEEDKSDFFGELQSNDNSTCRTNQAKMTYPSNKT